MALKVYFFGSMDESKSRNEDDDKAEREALEKRARGVIGILLGIILGFTGLSWGIFAYANCQHHPNVLGLCVCVSIVGSATAAFMSCLQRVSEGWELADGQQIPKPNNKERFNAKIAYFLLFRPFLGILIGFIIYFAALGHVPPFSLAFDFKQPFTSTFLHKLLFMSLVGGFFAKTVLDKLKEIFESLIFGNKKG